MEKNLSFRDIVKTFIPGFIVAIAIVAVCDLIIFLIFGSGHEWMILGNVARNTTCFVAMVIPFSIFSGIIINTFCFVFLFKEIRRFSEKKQECLSFLPFRNQMMKMMKDYYAEHFKYKDVAFFSKNFDVKSFLLNSQTMENLQYIRTGYYYYLEFQINSIIAIIISSISFILNIALRKFDANTISREMRVILIIVVIVLAASLAKLLWKAILKNNFDYEKKELSYLMGAFHICRAKRST